MNEETCVICGEPSPEGKQVCGKCSWYAGGIDRMTIKKKIGKLWVKVFAEQQKKRELLDKAKEQEDKIANLIYKIKKLEEKNGGEK